MMTAPPDTPLPSCWNEPFVQIALKGHPESRNTVPSPDYESWEGHLAQCAPCRQALEGRAGTPTDWHLAKDFLASDSKLGDFPSVSERIEKRRSHLMSYVQQHVRPHPSDDPQSLGRLGPYELVGIVGRGGMGIVFKAFDRALNRFVAIKILDPLVADRDAARARFAREARAMAAISHEHVVPIYAVDEHESLPFFVMEFVPGGTLEHRLATEGPMATLPWLRVAIQIAQGLEAAHRQGLIHRDIKPSNILLDRGVERVRVTDFGLAREVDRLGETCSEVIIGTPLYMSPEQVLGRHGDARSDLFSLGSLLFQLASGHPPFAGDSIYAILRNIASEPPLPLHPIDEAPAWLDAMILKLLAKDPEERFENATELIDALTDELRYLLDRTGPVPARRWQKPMATSREWSYPFSRSLRKATLTSIVAIGMLSCVALMWRLIPLPSMQPRGLASPLRPTEPWVPPNQDPAPSPEIDSWRKQIVESRDHKTMAFELGPKLMQIDPESARQAAVSAWPEIRSQETKTGLLKAFQFGKHAHVLAILHLGMTDADPKVRDYANHYLKTHTFQSFEGQMDLYDHWYRTHAQDSLDTIHEAGLRRLLEDVKTLSCQDGIKKLDSYDLKWDLTRPSNVQLAAIARRLGYDQVALTWLHDDNVPPQARLQVLQMLTAMKVPIGPREERLFAKWERDARALYASAIFQYRSTLDAEGVSQRLEYKILALLDEPSIEEAKSVAEMLISVDDDRAIPLQIAIIDADNSYDTVYGIGYFGLGQGTTGKKTKVRYSRWHDGSWWRKWWDRNQHQFSPASQKFPILDLPKTLHGQTYQPIEWDIETREGRQALGKHLLEHQTDGWHDIADLCDLANDPRDIPFLIGLLDADNSSRSIYHLAHFGIIPLANRHGKHQLTFSPYRDGGWWKRWWTLHSTDFGPECEQLPVPVFNKTPFGKNYQPLPENIESPAGRRWLIQQELGQPEPNVANLAIFFQQFGDQRDLPWLVPLMTTEEPLEGRSLLANLAIAKLANLQGLENLADKDANWWTHWWHDNHARFGHVDSSLPNIHDWIRKGPAAAPPIQTWTNQGATASYYRLGGEDTSLAPPQGFKLLVILPGGDGGHGFFPFVKNIFQHSLDTSWIVVQPVAIQWTPNQQVVWPTSINPVDGMKFTTEVMVEGIIKDIQAQFPIDPQNIVSMSWSSSGPAAYAFSQRPESPIRGSYIAMSVFKLPFLPDPNRVKEHRYVIEHSPEDKLCPFHMAELARKTLRNAGATVTDVNYAGGHGWHGNAMERIQSALRKLTP